MTKRLRRLYVVWGAAYATPNIGDMAVATAIIELLRSEDSGARIAFVTSGRHDLHLAAYDDVTIVDAWRQPIRLLRMLRASKLLLVAGGVPFGDSTASLLRFIVLAAAARCAGAQVSILAASAADARLHVVNELLCRAILALAATSSVRDQNSMRLLQRLKGADAIGFVPDLVLALDLQTRAASGLRPTGLVENEPYVVVAPRNFLAEEAYLRRHFAASFAAAQAPTLLAALVETLEVLGRDRRVVFLPMNVAENDHLVGRRAAALMTAQVREPILIEDALSVDEACALLSGADLVLGMRLHAVIIAVALSRPTVAIAYAGKVSGFMEWLGLAQDTLPLSASSEQLLEACERRLSEGLPPHLSSVLERARHDIVHHVAALHPNAGPHRLTQRR